MTKALYPLSADPFHNGHLSTLKTALSHHLFDEIIVGIGINPEKKNKYLFSLEERVMLAQKSCHELAGRIRVEPVEGMVAHAAVKKGASVILRSARTAQDFAYEQVIADVNKSYGLATVILPASSEYGVVSSTVVKALVQEGALCHSFVHPAVKQALEEKLRKITLIGVTGNMGAGKTTVCKELVRCGAQQNMQFTHFDCDAVVHSIYEKNTPYPQAREQVIERFGNNIMTGTEINRKALAHLVFSDQQTAQDLSNILKIPGRIALEQAIRNTQGILLVDAAYLVEENLLPLVNYNVILVQCDAALRKSRVCARDQITEDEFLRRSFTQFSSEELKKKIGEQQKKVSYGLCIEYDTTTTKLLL